MKIRVNEICVKRIRVNQGLGVLPSYVKQQNQDFMNEHKKVYKNEVHTSKKFKSI